MVANNFVPQEYVPLCSYMRILVCNQFTLNGAVILSAFSPFRANFERQLSSRAINPRRLLTHIFFTLMLGEIIHPHR
jgi:hypothetical protein